MDEKLGMFLSLDHSLYVTSESTLHSSNLIAAYAPRSGTIYVCGSHEHMGIGNLEMRPCSDFMAPSLRMPMCKCALRIKDMRDLPTIHHYSVALCVASDTDI